MKYFSMFSGIGGFELGIQGVVEGAECVGYSEVDTHAIKTYKEHYEHTNFGDATTIDPARLLDFDLLVGGFPCQAFSIAGRRGGFNDTRGTLFFDIARILKHKRPRHLVLENVKGLLSHDGGKTIQTIAGVLTDLGYRIEWQVLNSKDHGVPQNRERIYIVGHLRGGCGGQVFPIRAGDSKATFGTVTSVYHKGQTTGSYIDEAPKESASITIALTEVRTDEAKELRRKAMREGKDFTPRRAKELSARTDGKIGAITSSRNRDNLLAEVEPYDHINGHAKTLDANYYKGLMANQSRTGVSTGVRIRRLTPTECERLQGFPDNWTIGSDTQRYKQCGNAVTVNVVEAVIRSLLYNGCLE